MNAGIAELALALTRPIAPDLVDSNTHHLQNSENTLVVAGKDCHELHWRAYNAPQPHSRLEKGLLPFLEHLRMLPLCQLSKLLLPLNMLWLPYQPSWNGISERKVVLSHFMTTENRSTTNNHMFSFKPRYISQQNLTKHHLCRLLSCKISHTLRAFVTWPERNSLITASLIISEWIPRSRRCFSLFNTQCGILPIPK